jgi:hypothetical protein
MDMERRDYPEISAVDRISNRSHKQTFDAGLEILLEGIRKEAERAAMR